MGYRDPTYVIFDGDNDGWAYRFMRGWKANEHVDFDFRDAHDLDNMTGAAQNEAYVKAHLRKRMEASAAVIVLVGEKTRWLYKFVRWEIELALSLALPIILINLNDKKLFDNERAPPILRDACTINTVFKLKAIRFALDTWPAAFAGFNKATRLEGPRYYNEATYKSMGL